MRKLVYYLAVTRDGFIAGPGGEFDFFPFGDGAHHHPLHEGMITERPGPLPASGHGHHAGRAPRDSDRRPARADDGA